MHGYFASWGPNAEVFVLSQEILRMLYKKMMLLMVVVVEGEGGGGGYTFSMELRCKDPDQKNPEWGEGDEVYWYRQRQSERAKQHILQTRFLAAAVPRKVPNPYSNHTPWNLCNACGCMRACG